MLPQEKTVIVLGGGYSVKELGVDLNTLKNYGHVIGVNDSAVHADVSSAISMDRLWMVHRGHEVQKKHIPTLFRVCAFSKSGLVPWYELKTFKNDNKTALMTTDEGVLNGTSSGMCALNLAYQMKPDKVFLFGFDMKRLDPKGGAYWYPPYSWTPPKGGTTDGKYGAWAKQFETMAIQFLHAGISVVNVSPKSAINTWKKIDYKRFKEVCPLN